MDSPRKAAVPRADIQRALREFTQLLLFWGTALALADLAQYAEPILRRTAAAVREAQERSPAVE